MSLWDVTYQMFIGVKNAANKGSIDKLSTRFIPSAFFNMYCSFRDI